MATPLPESFGSYPNREINFEPASPFQINLSPKDLQVDRSDSSSEWHILPRCLRELPSKLFWRCSLCRSKLSTHHTVKSIQRANTSTRRAIYSLPSDFERTVLGNNIVKIIQFLQKQNVFSGTPEGIFQELKQKISQESCNTGEAMQRLIRFNDPSSQMTHLSIPFFTLLEKIRRRVCLVLDDVDYSILAQKTKQTASLDAAVKRIADCTRKLFMEGPIADLEQALMRETQQVQETLLEEKKRIHQLIAEKDGTVEHCNAAINGLLQLEQEAFFCKVNGTSLLREILKKASSLKDLEEIISHIGSSAHSLLVRCIIIDKGEVSSIAIVGAIGEENTLFMPREGDVKYISKQNCVSTLEHLLKAAIQNKKTIEVTVWRKIAPSKSHRTPREDPLPSMPIEQTSCSSKTALYPKI